MDFLDGAFADMAQLNEAYSALCEAAARAGVDPDALARVAEAEEAADLEYLRERVPAAVERSRDGLKCVAKIVGAMRVFGHPSTNGKAPVDVNAAIENTLVVAASEYKYIADVTTDLGDVPPVLSNGGDINQVLINLIVNSCHAIADLVDDSGERGRIDIRTSVDGDAAIITIADTGGGIPASIAERVFDPFFTTKDVGKGTGQGLAIARTIIDRDLHHPPAAHGRRRSAGSRLSVSAGARPQRRIELDDRGSVDWNTSSQPDRTTATQPNDFTPGMSIGLDQSRSSVHAVRSPQRQSPTTSMRAIPSPPSPRRSKPPRWFAACLARAA
jgi:hypothetical protein